MIGDTRIHRRPVLFARALGTPRVPLSPSQQTAFTSVPMTPPTIPQPPRRTMMPPRRSGCANQSAIIDKRIQCPR
jgi:hypothetical protein